MNNSESVGNNEEYCWETNLFGEPVIIYKTEFLKDGEIAVHLGRYKNRTNEDFAHIVIQPGCSTPLQLLNKERAKTREISVRGKGFIQIWRKFNNEIETSHCDPREERKFSVEVYQGDTIQIVNVGDEEFHFIEICNPRFDEEFFVEVE